VLAGIGRGQLRVLDERVAARRAVFDRYVQGLAGIDAIQWMPEAKFGRSTRWLTACALKGPIGADVVIQKLAAERIEARRVWKPMHQQPLFASAEYFPHALGQDVAGELFARGVCLPSGSNMSIETQQRIIDTMIKVLSA
jgi:pyridoxal phosphate-dependent aminotransferase EpsN